MSATTTVGRGSVFAFLLVICLAPAARAGNVAVADAGTAGLVSGEPLSPRVLGYSDVDKSHDGAGGWGTNYYDDLNSNGAHDPGEPFGDSADPSWTNATSGTDNSCWMASGCNMLQQLGVISDAAALYNQYALNGVPTTGGTLTWDEGGLQEDVIQYWMSQNPTVAAGMTVEIHWRSSTVHYTDGMSAWEDWNPRTEVAAYLAAGWQVALGMWPLYFDGTNSWHGGGHALTIQTIGAGTTFSCTDSDRDADFSDSGDVNTYTDAARGPTAFLGHNYYAWYNDFYDGDIAYYPVGDVGYIIAIIPEPASIAITALGAVLILRPRRRIRIR
ncbi:MAG TPA: hypothetical protein PK082_03930 [Phycisphaerae bacterium]|nr:hypothetical protein [Phycisphaerae bacterium]